VKVGVERLLVSELSMGGRAVPAPLRFLFELGAHAADAAADGDSLHVGVVLPDEGYAAVCVSFGAVVRRAVREPSSAGEDAKRHFERLCGLPEGTSVWLVERGRRYRAIHEGVVVGSDGASRLYLRRESARSGGLTVGVPAHRSLDVIEATDEVVGELPLNQSGTSLRGSPDLLAAVYGAETNAVLTTSRLDALIVGRKDTVSTELEVEMSCPTGSGSLADMLRVSELGFSRTYRTRWLSSGSESLPELAVRGRAPVAVLNGAANHLAAFQDVHGGVSVSVIGATEPQAYDAIQDMQSALFVGTHRAEALPVDLHVPPGVSTFSMKASR
jgi:hypothetical protein